MSRIVPYLANLQAQELQAATGGSVAVHWCGSADREKPHLLHAWLADEGRESFVLDCRRRLSLEVQLAQQLESLATYCELIAATLREKSQGGAA